MLKEREWKRQDREYTLKLGVIRLIIIITAEFEETEWQRHDQHSPTFGSLSLLYAAAGLKEIEWHDTIINNPNNPASRQYHTAMLKENGGNSHMFLFELHFGLQERGGLDTRVI